jgi:hypothetical protein
MSANSFEGYLESYEVRGADIELRFAAGGFDPFPPEPPILHVLVRNANNIAALRSHLASLQTLDDYTYVESVSQVEVLVHSDHGEPLFLRGESVSLRADQYAPRDFERLAKINHEWGQSQYASVTKALAKLTEVERLAQDQAQRVHAKCQSHAVGSTARTLYEQHLTFIGRLVETLKA